MREVNIGQYVVFRTIFSNILWISHEIGNEEFWGTTNFESHEMCKHVDKWKHNHKEDNFVYCQTFSFSSEKITEHNKSPTAFNSHF